MLRVSGPELVAAACSAGVIGSFPTANARGTGELEDWIGRITGDARSGFHPAPYAANLIMRSPRLDGDLEVLVKQRSEVVITSVGSPLPVIEPLHQVGAVVLSGVATVRHAELAVSAGADGLVLLSAGAGGHTGSMNPFAFVRAVRAFFDGPVVLSGGLGDGQSLAAARLLGCDLGMMGTAFLATTESRAAADYKELVVSSSMDDVVLTRAFTGLPSNMLGPSIRLAGLNPAALDETATPAQAAQLYGSGGTGPKRWTDIWSAGHSVSGVPGIVSVAELVNRIAGEYQAAANASR